MSIATAKQFVSVLQKSRLLKPKHLAAVRTAAEKDPDPKALAGRLVKKGLLSRWQARQLLAGHVSFFLGEYRLVETLTTHPGSHVYQAEHETLGRRVVLKRLPRNVMADQQRKKRLLAAVRAVVGFEHEDLARVYSIEQSGDRYYVISQYVEGRDLDAMVAETGPLAFPEAAAAVSQAAAGLAEVHRRKAVHGGVRPSNLVVGPDGLVKLVAVATARRYEATEQAGADQDDSAVLDAAHYQAPELLKADADPTPASDVYSLGCTLYFLLTGKPPFAEGTAGERALAHARHQPPGILRGRSDTPDVLVKACRKMLAKRPEDRFSSADEIVELLADLCPPRRSAARIVATVSARVPNEESAEGKDGAAEGKDGAAEGKERKKAIPRDKNDVKAPAGEASASPEAESEHVSSDAPADTPEAEKPASNPAQKDRKPGPQTKTPERRLPAKAPATAKPAPRRPAARGAAGDRESKTADTASKRKSPASKSAGAFAVDTGGADSPVARAKTRAGKTGAPSEEAPAAAEAGSPEGFLQKHRKWLFIGGGSAAALLLVVAVTVLFALNSSSGEQAGTETAMVDGAEPAVASPRKTPRTMPDVIDDLDLESELDLNMDLGIDDTPVRRSRDPEPDEEPDAPAEDEEAAEDKEPAEKDDMEPADSDQEPEPDGDKPEEAKPDEAEEKPPEKKPEPPKKEKPPTFRDFPETVELPLPVADEGQPASTEPLTLGKLYVRERAPWIVVLSGGEVVVPNAEIEFGRDAAEVGGRAYIARLTPKGGAATAIARLWYEPETDQLKFQWLEAAAKTQGAGLLRLCQVNLTIDGESKTLALSKPAPAPPLAFDLEKRVDRVTIESDSLPDDKLLRLEITGIEGVDPKHYPFQTKPDGPVEVKRPLTLTLQRMDRHQNPQPIAQFQITLTSARKGLTIMQRVEQPLKRIVPPNAQLPMLRQQAEEEFKKLAAQLKKAQGSAERDKFLQPMNQIEVFLGQADLFEMIDKQAKIHYRILMQAGNHQVPLYDSQVAGQAGEGEAPEQ